MSVYIKNTTVSTKTYQGQDISAGTYYLIPETERVNWASDDTLLTDIGSGDAVVAATNDGNNDYGVNAGINYLKNKPGPTDTDGAPLQRTKMTKTGWHYQCHAIEFISSKLASVHNADRTDTDLGFTSIKFYNSSDVELTAGTQTELDNNCVKTVITLEQEYDFEIIGGNIYQGSQPSVDVRLWVTAAPDLTVAQGGSVPFCQGGANLKHMGAGLVFDIDGKTPKMMAYNATYHTNKFEITLHHPTGHQHAMMMIMKLYRENT